LTNAEEQRRSLENDDLVDLRSEFGWDARRNRNSRNQAAHPTP
jgi:hypothetical protein